MDKISIGGPIYKEFDGYKVWYLNGKRHRTDGPAVEWADGTKWWYLNGERHRTDGPAIEYADGYEAWWLNGVEHSFKQFIAKTPISEVEKTRLMLIYE